jgi:hypothetical protein
MQNCVGFFGVLAQLLDGLGRRHAQAGHGFVRTDSGHEVADLSGQVGLGFGRLSCSFPPSGALLAVGCGEIILKPKTALTQSGHILVL